MDELEFKNAIKAKGYSDESYNLLKQNAEESSKQNPNLYHFLLKLTVDGLPDLTQNKDEDAIIA